MSKQKRTIALDFDGVLHQYDGWQGGNVSPPIAGAKEAVENLRGQGHEVVVFTTRDKDQVEGWLRQYGFPALEVTNIKRPFYVLVDDRAIRFDGSWSDDMLKAISEFDPYWVKARKPAQAAT